MIKKKIIFTLLLKLLDLDTSYIKKIRDIFVTNTKNKSENLLAPMLLTLKISHAIFVEKTSIKTPEIKYISDQRLWSRSYLNAGYNFCPE